MSRLLNLNNTMILTSALTAVCAVDYTIHHSTIKSSTTYHFDVIVGGQRVTIKAKDKAEADELHQKAVLALEDAWF